MRKNIIIVCCIILGVCLLLWGADFIVSFYPPGWKEKAIELNDFSDKYIPPIICGFVVIGLLLRMIFFKKSKCISQKK